MLIDRWAEAFINSCGEDTAEGLSALKVMIPCIAAISGNHVSGGNHVSEGHVSGTQDSLQVEKILRSSLKMAAIGNIVSANVGYSSGVEIALRTVVLLVRKGLFKQSAALLLEIEKRVDKKNGIILAVVETVAPLDAEFRKTLETAIRQKTGAREVKLTERLVPDLLGGYKLRIAGTCLDASLRSLLQNLAREMVGE
jgi:F0F1-type ATP synthase delta subunit